MSFTAAGAQSGIDADCTGLTSITGVTTVDEGRVTVYTIPGTLGITVSGTWSINPEIERVVLNRTGAGNVAIEVLSGGHLNVGVEISTTNGVAYDRFSIGLAIEHNALPVPWWGGTNGQDNAVIARDGSTLIWRGASFASAKAMTFDPGSKVLIQDAVWLPRITGQAGRGSIFYSRGSDIRVDGFKVYTGGEFLIGPNAPSGLSSLIGSTLPAWNGFTAYSAGDEVSYTNNEYEVKTGQSVTAPVGTLAQIDYNFDITATWPTVGGGEEAILVGGFTGGILKNDDATKVNFDLTTAGSTGIWNGNAGLVRVYNNQANANDAVTSWVGQINEVDYFPFTASKVTSPNIVTLRLISKAVETDFGTPVFTSSANAALTVSDLVVTEVILPTPNTTPDLATAIWEDKGGAGLPNGIFGHEAVATVYAAFPNRIGNNDGTFENPSITIENSRYANNGNVIDVTVQSEKGDVVPPDINTIICSKTLVVNEAGGTDLKLIGGETTNDRRNWGIVWVGRDVNFDIADGLTEAPITGGRWFMRDNNNGQRVDRNNTDETADRTYTGVFSEGVSTTTARVLLGVVNVPKASHNRNTSNSPTGTGNNVDYRYDLRGMTNLEGEDNFDFLAWVYENNYLPLFNTTLSPGTTGTQVIRVRTTTDTNVSKDRAAAEMITGTATVGEEKVTSYTINFPNTFSTNTTDGVYIEGLNTNIVSSLNPASTTLYLINGDGAGQSVFENNIQNIYSVSTATTAETCIDSWVSVINALDDIRLSATRSGTSIILTLDTSVVFTPDITVVNYNQTAYSSTDINYGSSPRQLSIATAFTLDDLYDFLKLKKENSEAEIQLPDPFRFVLQSDGTTLDFYNRNMVWSGTGAVSIGMKHTKINHDTTWSLANTTLNGGIEVTAPTLTGLPTAIGTSILNSTNIIVGTGAHIATSGSTINNSLAISGNANSFSGRINGDLVISDTDSDVNTINGTVTGLVTAAGSGLHTMNGTVNGAVAIASGSISADSNSVKGSTITAGGIGNSLVNGSVGGKVTLGNSSTKHTVGANIAAGGLQMGTGTKHLVSGGITGPVTTTGTIDTQSTYVGSSTLDASGAGDSVVNGISGGKVTLGNASAGHTVGAAINAGGLQMGTGAHTATGTIVGPVTTTGTMTTGLVYNGSSTLDASGTGDSTIAGTSGDKVTLGNSSTKHTVSATISGGGLQMGTGTLHALSGDTTGAINTTGTISSTSVFRARSTVTSTATGVNSIEGEIDGLLTLGVGNQVIDATLKAGATLGNGAHTIDGTLTGPISTGNGNTGLNGQLTGNLTDGTGTLIFGPSASMNGTLTKSGSGNTNSSTMTSTQAGTIDLVVPAGTLELFGAVRANYKSVTGLTNDNAIPTTTSFQVGSGLPSGRVIFKDRAAAAGTYIMDVTHTNGVVTTLGTFNNNSGSPTEYDIYYKPTNTFGSDGVFWTTTIVNSDNSASTNRTVDVTATPHAGVLTRAAEDADLTGLSAVMNTITTQTIANITISGATIQIDAPKTQALLMRVTDDANYLNLLANTNAELDDILPGLQSGSTVNQARFTLQAANQQSITALSGTGTGTLIGTITAGGLTFAAVFVFPNPAGLSGPEAQVACEAAIDGRAVDGQSIQTAVTAVAKRGVLTNIGQP